MDMLFYFMIFYDIVFFAMGLVLSHPNVLKIENDKTQYIYIYIIINYKLSVEALIRAPVNSSPEMKKENIVSKFQQPRNTTLRISLGSEAQWYETIAILCFINFHKETDAFQQTNSTRDGAVRFFKSWDLTSKNGAMEQKHIFWTNLLRSRLPWEVGLEHFHQNLLKVGSLFDHDRGFWQAVLSYPSGK